MPPDFSGSHTPMIVEVQSRDKSAFVHSQFLAAQSESLRSSITAEGRIDLLEWDGDTAGRLVEFLYSGDYNVSRSKEDSGDEDEDYGKRLRRDGTVTLHSVQSLVGLGSTNVLLAHAKVYALAKSKDVEALRTMALERVREGLRGILGFMLVRGSTLILDVIELLDYVYSHTGSPKRSEEPMRDIMSTFVAVNFEKLMDEEEMGILLDKEGDLAADLRVKVARTLYNERRRLCDVEWEVQDWKDQFSMSEEKVQQLEAKVHELEITNAEKLRRSEATYRMKTQQLEIINAEKVRRLEAQMQELEVTNTKIRKSEAANMEALRQSWVISAAKVRELEDANREKLRQLEVIDKERKSWAAVVTKVQQLEAANTEKLHKISELEDSIAAIEREDEWKGPIFTVLGWDFSLYTLFCVAMVLMVLVTLRG